MKKIFLVLVIIVSAKFVNAQDTLSTQQDTIDLKVVSDSCLAKDLGDALDIESIDSLAGYVQFDLFLENCMLKAKIYGLEVQIQELVIEDQKSHKRRKISVMTVLYPDYTVTPGKECQSEARIMRDVAVRIVKK